jgi:hypothetical protein
MQGLIARAGITFVTCALQQLLVGLDGTRGMRARAA